MKFETVLKPFVAAAMCVCTAFGGADAATGSGGGTPVTITVKDWTGKVVTTVKGVTFDGNFKLDTADHFNGKVDYVTAFDGGTVVKNGTNSERASSSIVTYAGISGESFATEVFVQPYVPTADGYKIADPFGGKAPNENQWVFTGTTGSSIKLASLTSFPTALNALTLWSAKDISNFADGYSSAVWAPEILYVRGNWYVYFSASTSSDTTKERSFVMSYKGAGSSGLTTKANWNTATRIVTPDDKWAIDGTVFEGRDGKLYYVWSGWAGNTNVRQDIYLAPMDTPTTIAPGAKRTLVSIPDQSWETQPADHPLVEEGPAVLQKGDKTIIVFSGNGSWKQYYSLGYTVCSDGNYTNADSWKKHEGTVFTKRSFAYGPGHCSFTKDANGLDYIIYHATPTATAPSGSDYWSIRTARLQPFAWHNDEPVFGAPRPTSGTNLAPDGESYDVTKSWTKSGSADKTFIHAPTAETVTGKVGSTVSPTFLANDYFTVSGTTSLSESKTVTLTLALKDASTTAWDDGTTGSKTCKFTAELTGEPASQPGADSSHPLRVLMLGNSYSQSLLYSSPGGSEAATPGLDGLATQYGRYLNVFNPYYPGFSLKQHWENHDKKSVYERFERRFVSKFSAAMFLTPANSSLDDILASEKWDIVTLQQTPDNAADSTYSTWEPYFGNLVALIKEKAPTAKIWLHQTWSHSPRYGTASNLAVMNAQYDTINQNYLAIAEKYKDDVETIIPVGYAIQLARNRSSPTSYLLMSDWYHVDVVGQYLQAQVWAAKLFNVEPSDSMIESYGDLSEVARQAIAIAKEAVNAQPWQYAYYTGEIPEEPPHVHDWGAWRTTKEPEIGVAGEKTRTCRSTGCGAIETQVIPALPPEDDPTGGPVGREITSVTPSQDGRTCALAFAAAGEGASDLKVWAVADVEDRGTDGTNGWAKVASVGILEKARNEMTFAIPSDFGWGTEAKVMRFLTTPAYDATLTGLKGAGSGQKAGPYIDTGFTPHLSDNKVVVEFTPDGYSSAYAQAVASAREAYSTGHRLGVFLANDGYIRVDYQTGNAQPPHGQIRVNGWTAGNRFVATFDGGSSSVTLKGVFGGVEDTKSYAGQIKQPASKTLLVFATRSGSEIDNIATSQVTVHDVRVYGAEGKTVHDYVPVVADGVNTLYDKVDGKLMDVSGAGSFGAGGTPSPVAPLSWSASVSRDGPPTSDPEQPSGDVTAGPIPGHADWGYVNTYTQGGKSYAAYVYTNVTAEMTFAVPDGVTAIDYLVVGGGGAGGRFLSGVVAGGGGAGGLLQGAGVAVSANQVLTLTVGKGGVQNVNGGGRTQANSPGEDKFKGITSTVCNGFDSVIRLSGVELLRAYGGAGGGAKGATKRGGGSGGGTGAGTAAYVAMPGTDGQGHDGGARESAFSNCAGATGGGGAGSAGGALTDASSKDGTNGGEGLQSSITGELLWYAAGGGGAAVLGGTHGKGGNGIGGDGAATGTPGLDGTGSGGGGSSTNGTKGGDGGSGVIVIRYATSGGDPEPAKPTVGDDPTPVDPKEVFNTARSDKPIVYPSKPKLAGEIGAQTITFDGGEPVKVPEYYTATLGEDERTVTLALNDNAKPAFGDETAVEDGEKAVEVTDGTVKLHLADVRPELYYTLKRCETLGDTWEPVVTVKGDADGFNGNFSDNMDGAAGFYKVDVSDVPTP